MQTIHFSKKIRRKNLKGRSSEQVNFYSSLCCCAGLSLSVQFPTVLLPFTARSFTFISPGHLSFSSLCTLSSSLLPPPWATDVLVSPLGLSLSSLYFLMLLSPSALFFLLSWLHIFQICFPQVSWFNPLRRAELIRFSSLFLKLSISLRTITHRDGLKNFLVSGSALSTVNLTQFLDLCRFMNTSADLLFLSSPKLNIPPLLPN